MATSPKEQAQFNDSFFFVTVKPSTAKKKAPCRNQKSRSHVMRFVRRRDKIEGKWGKSAADRESCQPDASSQPEPEASNSTPTIKAEEAATPGPWTPVSSSFPDPTPSINFNSLPSPHQIIDPIPKKEFSRPKTAYTRSPVVKQMSVANLLITGDDEIEEGPYADDDALRPSDLLRGVSSSDQPREEPEKEKALSPYRILDLSTVEKSWHAILHFYKQTLFGCAFSLSDPEERCNELFRFAFSDETVMTALVMIAEADQSFCFASPSVFADRGRGVLQVITETPRSAKLKGHVITSISKRVNDSMDGTSDAVILAVYKVMVTEAFLGNFREAKIHQQGLANIIRMRGGLDKIPIMLAQGVMLAESLLPFTTPMTPVPKSFGEHAELTLRDFCAQNGVTMLEEQPSPESLFPSFCNDQLGTILHSIEDMVQFANMFGVQPQSNRKLAKVAQAYQLKYFVIKIQLSNYEPQNQLESVFVAAMSAFLTVTFIWGNPGCAPLRELVRYVDRHLTGDIHTLLWKTAPEILLWIAFIGAFGSLEQDGHTRFLDIIRTCAGRLDLSTWLRCRQHLRKVLFYKGRIDPHFENIWRTAMVT